MLGWSVTLTWRINSWKFQGKEASQLARKRKCKKATDNEIVVPFSLPSISSLFFWWEIYCSFSLSLSLIFLWFITSSRFFFIIITTRSYQTKVINNQCKPCVCVLTYMFLCSTYMFLWLSIYIYIYICLAPKLWKGIKTITWAINMLQLEDGCAWKYVVLLIERHKLNYKKVWLITDLN